MGAPPEEVWNDEGEKLCLTCMEYKDPNLFHYRTKCKACYKRYQAEYRAKHREELTRRRHEMRAKKKEGSLRAKIKQDKQELEQRLEHTIEGGVCKFCDEDETAELLFLTPGGALSLNAAKEKFDKDSYLELICKPCKNEGRDELFLF